MIVGEDGGGGNIRLFVNSLDDGVKKILFFVVICFYENFKIKFKIRSFVFVWIVFARERFYRFYYIWFFNRILGFLEFFLVLDS